MVIQKTQRNTGELPRQLALRLGTAQRFVEGRPESIKGMPRLADLVLMTAFVDPPAVVRLRMLHRCLMCHKHCLIPCKFTALEWQQKIRDELDSIAPVAQGDVHRSRPVK